MIFPNRVKVVLIFLQISGNCVIVMCEIITWEDYMMKRFLSLLCTLMVLCAVLCTTAIAADFDGIAQELSAIGMFRGTGESFELDREPTRAEAAVMLVRLYGAEEKAQADYANGSITHPFTDVPNWTAPYVAWLYTNGLTKGMSDTTFGSTEICTDLNYTTFLLRALGYQDGVDFDYKEALSFAQELGFYNAETFAGPFLRDDLAALTYQALATDVKSGDTYLLAQLIATGAIAADAAQPMTEKMDAWRAFLQMVPDEPTALECNTVMNCDAVLTLDDTESMDMSMHTTTYTAQIGNDENLQYAEIAEVEYMGIPTTNAIYIKDGWLYTESYLGEIPLGQYKLPIPFDGTFKEDLATDDTMISLYRYSGVLAFDDVTVARNPEGAVYTINVANANLVPVLTDLISDLDIESMGEIISFQYENIQVIYTFDTNGQLQATDMRFSLHVETVSYEYGEPEQMRLDAQYDISVTYMAWNEDVQIIFPDFSDYLEISEEDYV